MFPISLDLTTTTMTSPVPIPKQPLPIPGMETYSEKAVRKFKQNPWVPLGSLATVGALCVAMVKMRRGQSQSFNHWLRVRVAAQGLTIVALVAGTYSMRPKDEQTIAAGLVGEDSTLTRNDVDVERRRLEKVAREKEEFEQRLKGAEEADEFERVLRARRSGGGGAGPASVSETGEKGSWTKWLGWGRGSSTDNSKSSKDRDESKKS
ncbi:Respiratory supercomplex factor 1, mitochondrial [Hypsizygus marmoreus]|uniref:Respiratory supercomplex factor 1, mitochondrial n=1 Tax=Hypsizygus marmoreus TaxID=39966 RepID=A0A369JJ27_HYPMA|nr:Respiratory supercomplex factor 1, mitochondrial [Hypsizygus marmoreus]